MQAASLPKRPKLRPEVGPPTTAAKPNPTRKAHRLTLWEARPAANAGRRPAQKAKASPRGRGLPPQRQNHPTREHTALPCGRRAPRRCRPQACPKGQSFAPRSGLPQKPNPNPTAHRSICRRRAPAANAGCKPARKAKASPRGRASHNGPLSIGYASRREAEPNSTDKIARTGSHNSGIVRAG